jgi:hypothetical protein
MSDLENLASKRLDRVTDNRKATVLDALRAAAHDIERGTIKADAVLVVMMDRPTDKPWEQHLYRAGVTREQEVCYLDLAHDLAKRLWREDQA